MTTIESAGDRLLPYWDDTWPVHVKVAMRELADLGVELDLVDQRRGRLLERRKGLYMILDKSVPHRVIAAVAGSTKGAVEQALTKARKEASG
jgi:hypothetical protein